MKNTMWHVKNSPLGQLEFQKTLAMHLSFSELGKRTSAPTLFRQNARFSTSVYCASPIERASNAPPHLVRCAKPWETAGAGGRGRCPSKTKIDKRKIEESSANHPATNLTHAETCKGAAGLKGLALCRRLLCFVEAGKLQVCKAYGCKL